MGVSIGSGVWIGLHFSCWSCLFLTSEFLQVFNDEHFLPLLFLYFDRLDVRLCPNFNFLISLMDFVSSSIPGQV